MRRHPHQLRMLKVGSPNLEDVAEVGEVIEPSDPKEGGAASSAPKGKGHPLDDVPLADLAGGEPLKDDVLKKEAEPPEHLSTHFPKNPFCRICNLAKNTSKRVAHKLQKMMISSICQRKFLDSLQPMMQS